MRNRKTGKVYSSQFGQFAPVDTFNQTFAVAPTDKKQEMIQSILHDVMRRLPTDLDPEVRQKFRQNFKSQLSSPEFTNAMEDPAVLDSIEKLREAGEKLHAHTANDSASMSALLKSFAKSWVPFAISHSFPIAGLLLSALPAAAAMTNWQIHEGMPDGGTDLCASVLVYGCLQGFLTNGTQPWTIGNPQFSRIISEIAGKDSPTDSTYITLRNCLDINTVGGVSTAVLNANPDVGAGISCTGTSAPWDKYSVTGVATGLPSDSCVDYQNTFNVAVIKCQDAWSRAGTTAAIIGGTLGACCLCACIIGGIYYAKQRDLDCNIKCPCV